MGIREVEPIIADPDDVTLVEQEIVQALKHALYLPLLAEITSAKVLNDNKVDEISAALRSGRISYYRGRFSGKFSAGLAKALKGLGASWDRRQGSFNISLNNLPEYIVDTINASESAFLKMAERFDRKLYDVSPEEIADKINLTRIYDRTVFRTDNKITESLKGMIVTTKLTEEMRAKIAERYTNNMRLLIKDWTEDEIKSLREKMKRSVLSGKRHEDMIKTIQRSYGVAQTKARFLARQETNLLVTHLRKERYTDAGVMTYRWVTSAGSPDHPVRHSHKILDGKIFSWDDAPVTDSQGNRNHPGEDFNCRCIARPIVRFKQ